MLEQINLTPTIFVLYTLSQYAAFWIARWAKARQAGMVGLSRTFTALMDLWAILAVAFGWLCFAFVWWQIGFLSAAALGLVGLGGRFLLIMATAPIMRGRREEVLWLSGTLAFWPLAIGTIVTVNALPPIS